MEPEADEPEIKSRLRKMREEEQQRKLEKEKKRVVGYHDKRPDLNGCESFQDFLKKYPICNQIHTGMRIGFKLNKETLIKKILDFFQDQGINEYAYKICMGDEGGTEGLEEILNKLDIPQLKGIPQRFYDCSCNGETRLDDSAAKLLKLGVPPPVRKRAGAKGPRNKPKTERDTNRKKRKRKRKKKKSQKGGFCFPCLAPVFAGAGATIGGASFISNSFYNSSQKTITSGPQGKKEKSSESSRSEQNINGKKTKKKISRRGKLVKIGDNKIKTDNLKSAKMLYNKLKHKYLN